MIDHATITKPKIPKGLSYVLKTSWFEALLSDAELDHHVDLSYWLPTCGGSILEAFYWMPNPNVPYPRVYVRAGVVPSQQRKQAADLLVGGVFPVFVTWLRTIIDMPQNAPFLYTEPYFNAAYEDGCVEIEHDFDRKRVAAGDIGKPSGPGSGQDDNK